MPVDDVKVETFLAEVGRWGVSRGSLQAALLTAAESCRRAVGSASQMHKISARRLLSYSSSSLSPTLISLNAAMFNDRRSTARASSRTASKSNCFVAALEAFAQGKGV